MVSKSIKYYIPKENSGVNTSETNRNNNFEIKDLNYFEKKELNFSSNPSTRIFVYNNEKDIYSRNFIDWKGNNLFSEKSFVEVVNIDGESENKKNKNIKM